MPGTIVSYLYYFIVGIESADLKQIKEWIELNLCYVNKY